MRESRRVGRRKRTQSKGCVLPHFYGKISGYVVIYRGKDKNTTQGSLAELVGSPVAPAGCK